MTERSHAVSFGLPAYKEEANVVEANQRVSSVGDRLFADHEIVVVDDGSTDNTAKLVEELASGDPRVRLIRHALNHGYGEALRSGITSTTKELVFLTDADNQLDVEELARFLPWIERVDLVAGYRSSRLASITTPGWRAPRAVLRAFYDVFRMYRHLNEVRAEEPLRQPPPPSVEPPDSPSVRSPRNFRTGSRCSPS